MTDEPKTTAITISDYMRQPDVLAKFTDLLGDIGGRSYVQSVLIAVAGKQELMSCKPVSILRAALRAASLELSCDPALRQAYLVPYGSEAQFQPHYNGLYILAVRTNKYRVINVNPVYQGQKVYEDVQTGLNYIGLENGLIAENDKVHEQFGRGYRDVTSGKPDKPIIGYVGYLETVRGFKKTVYWTIGEIEAHAKKFSKSYQNEKSLWHDPKHKATMQRKTVLLDLLKYADLSGTASAVLREAIESDTIVDGASWDVPGQDEEGVKTREGASTQPEQKSEAELMAELGYDDLDDVDKTFPPKPAAPANRPAEDDRTKKVSHLDGDLIKHLIAQGVFKNEHNASAIMKQIIPDKAPFAAYVTKAQNYRAWRNRLTDGGIDKTEAILLSIEKANAGEACPEGPVENS